MTRARTELAQQLGLSSAQRLRLPSSLPTFVLPGLDAPALHALAVRSRPELQIASTEVNQARAEQRLQSGVLRTTEPTTGPEGMREYKDMSLTGLSIQITLPAFDTGQARRALTKAQLTQAEFTAEALQRQVSLEVERALANLVTTQRAAEIANQHLRQQQQLETLAQRAYEQGNIDWPHYRQVTRARWLSAQDRLQWQQALWVAMLDLERATGTAYTAYTKRQENRP